jgi:hypothetical protein
LSPAAPVRFGLRRVDPALDLLVRGRPTSARGGGGPNCVAYLPEAACTAHADDDDALATKLAAGVDRVLLTLHGVLGERRGDL